MKNLGWYTEDEIRDALIEKGCGDCFSWGSSSSGGDC